MSHQQQFPGWREALIEASIHTLRHYAPKGEPYWGCFSGGKDSVVIKELVRMAGVSAEWHYNVTTIDPPELVQFIREHHPDVQRDRPKRSMLQLIPERGLPTRRARWCCEVFKERTTPENARLIMGIRRAESRARAKNWQTFTRHRMTGAYVVAPILEWKYDDVWTFIRERNLPYCSLYDEGFKRLGCMGCPLARGSRKRDFARWPKVGEAFRRACHKLWENRAGTKLKDGREWFGSALFASADELFAWWCSDDPLSEHGKRAEESCQGVLEFWS